MSKKLIFTTSVIALDKIFNIFSENIFYIGMTNPNSLFSKIVNNHKRLLQQKLFLKKEKQKKSGREAQQDGENVKNKLAINLSFKGDISNITSQSLILLKHIDKNATEVDFINTKAHSDGKIACAKSDLKTTIVLKDKSSHPFQISLKSTYNKTQVAVHSVSTLEKHLFNLGIVIPDEAKEFLTHFTNSNSDYINKPVFQYAESRRRERYTYEEINDFNPGLFPITQLFFENHAQLILEFLISRGSENNQHNYATLLAFCDKNTNNLIFVDIKKLISLALAKCRDNNSFCLSNKARQNNGNNGSTTLRLFSDLISLQMKGSGTGAGYHSLQFNISGNNIKKMIEQNFNKESYEL